MYERSATYLRRCALPLCLCAGVAASGCASVNARPDFERAQALITERTGVEDVYDPAGDVAETLQSKTEALLEGGLTVDEAVAVAFLNNVAFQARFDDIGVSRAEVVQSRLLSNPSLALSLRMPDTGGRNNFSAGLAQQIVDIWQIPVRHRAALATLDQTVLGVVHDAVELRAQVKAAYTALVAAMDAGRVLDESSTVAAESAGLAQRRFDAGDVTLLDVNVLRATELAVKGQRMMAQRDRRLRERELARILGLVMADSPLALAESDSPWPEEPRTDGEYLALALENRLDAQMAGAAIRAAGEKVKEEVLKVLPDVTVGLDFEKPEQPPVPSRLEQGLAAFKPWADTRPNFPTQRERNLDLKQVVDTLFGPSLQITLPIFDQNQAQIAKARFVDDQSRKAYADLLQTIALDVFAAAETARTAHALVALYDESMLPLAGQNVESARRAYEADETDYLGLKEAQQSFLDRQREYIDAKRDFALSMIELERAVGGRLDMPAATPMEGGSLLHE